MGVGARVAAFDLDPAGVKSLAETHEEVMPYVCNLADITAVSDLAESVRADLGAWTG